MRRTLLPSLAAFSLAAAGFVAAAGCRPVPAAPPPIVLISIDTLRSDHLPAYGYGGGETPAIDRLARDGVLFERAFSHAAQTLPAHASLLTGVLPATHGVRDNVGFPLVANGASTLAERLGRAGYTTGGAVSSFVLRAETGISRGFERYDAPETPERPGRETLARLLPWLDEWRDGRPFLFFHLYEPHAPYRPPADLAPRFPKRYDGEIAAADRVVGELLATLDERGLYDRALIVLVSDHGEGLGDHGEEEHGFLLYREAIQVPLVVKLPAGARAGERVREAVGLVDVAPTLLEAAGLEPGPSLAGHSLLSEAPGSRPVYSETWSTFIHFGWSELLSAVDGRFHYIASPRPELFDLDADPGETTNLIATERRPGAALRAFLEPFPRELQASAAEQDAETLAKLGALGYLGGATATRRPNEGPLANPRDELPKVAPILRGIRAVNEGRYEDAIELLAPTLEQSPYALFGWQFLGRAYERLGRPEEAKAAYARGPRGDQPQDLMTVSAALRLLDLGRGEEALSMVRSELTRAPGSADLRLVESRALTMLGRGDEALAAADAAVAANPNLADARYQRAVVALSLGRAEAAETDLRAALALEPRHLQATKALAVLRFRLGDPNEAKRLLERALELSPYDPDATEGLAALAQGAGR